MKQKTITKVVSRNFIVDIIAKFQNIVGMNLSGYEKMINKGMKQIQDEIAKQKLKFKWFRYEITQLTNGAASITLYGDLK